MSELLTTDSVGQFNVDPDTTFGSEVGVINHTNADSIEGVLRRAVETYNDDDTEYPISMKNVAAKAEAAFDILSRSRAALIELNKPSLVKLKCGSADPNYDRFEPFFVAFPEYNRQRQMLFRGMAALSEVFHQINLRDQYLEGSRTISDDSTYTAAQHAARAEKRAFTRYPLDSFYDGDDYDHDGEYFDKSVVDGIHVCKTPIRNSLLVGANGNGLYAGRGNLSEGDVIIGLDRVMSDDRYENRKVEIRNEYAHRHALSGLSLPDTGALYNQHFHSCWEADLSCIENVVHGVASHDDVGLVSIHPITEAAYRREYDSAFGNDIDGYEPRDE